MAKQPDFAKKIYVTLDVNSDAPPEDSLLAWANPSDGVEDDGPTFVAVYALVEIGRAKKTLNFDTQKV